MRVHTGGYDLLSFVRELRSKKNPHDPVNPVKLSLALSQLSLPNEIPFREERSSFHRGKAHFSINLFEAHIFLQMSLSRYKFEPMFYVYVLLSEKDGQFYTGSTNDLERRFEEHNAGKVKSTAFRRPFKLIYYEFSLVEEDARRRERYLKSGMGKKYLKNRLRSYLKNL
jgi:putative endonuclease